MGRQGYLTAMALGRGHYEDEIVETAAEGCQSTQEYNDRGHPRNPETKRREREHVRAANEVMQVTGVVEDLLAAREKASKIYLREQEELLPGMKFMGLGRTVLVVGVWGVLGLRRRVLLYKPYVAMRFTDILRQERTFFGMPHMFFSGVPMLIALNMTYWAGYLVDTMVDDHFDKSESPVTERQKQLPTILRSLYVATSCYLTLHIRLFYILQQLNLVPASPWLPSLRSFIPFSSSSPLTMPPLPSMTAPSILACATALASTIAPMLVIFAHGQIGLAVSQFFYSPIYRTLPRPVGDSIFSGLAVDAVEFDAPDRPQGRQSPNSDEPTLRALEGLPVLDRQHGEASSDEDEVAHATLISFDVEATEAVENATGAWSAELRSANEPKASEEITYRRTGLTMLPVFMAAEGLREIVADIIVMPLEAVMVRVIATAYRASAGLPTEDLYAPGILVRGIEHIVSVLAMQVLVTGVTWAGFTVVTQYWARRHRARMNEQAAAIAEA